MREDVEASLRELIERSRIRWPDFRVSDESFLRFVAMRLEPAATLGEALSGLRVEDLFLVHACVAQDPKAQTEFDRLLRNVGRGLGVQRDIASDRSDDFMQTIREMLLVSQEGKRPGLELYSGKGSLSGWLRVVLLRHKARFIRAQRQEADLWAVLAEAFLAGGKDPERLNIRTENAQAIRDALRVVNEKLSSDERLLLRYWLVDGLTVEQIGRATQIHRMTAGRRLHRIRARILMLLRFELRNRLHLRDEELESLVRDIESRFDASLSGMLRSRSEEST